MTLSKEIIIKKEMKNRDRMGRLTQYVDDTEIDKLFNLFELINIYVV